jgi:hypothetical protein
MKTFLEGTDENRRNYHQCRIISFMKMSPLKLCVWQFSRSWYDTQTFPYSYKRDDISAHPSRYMTPSDSDHYLTNATLVSHSRHCRKTTTTQSRRAGGSDTFQGTAIFPEPRAGTLTNAGAHYSSNRWPEHIHLQGVAASPLRNFRHPTHYHMKGCTLFHGRKNTVNLHLTGVFHYKWSLRTSALNVENKHILVNAFFARNTASDASRQVSFFL